MKTTNTINLSQFKKGQEYIWSFEKLEYNFDAEGNYISEEIVTKEHIIRIEKVFKSGRVNFYNVTLNYSGCFRISENSKFNGTLTLVEETIEETIEEEKKELIDNMGGNVMENTKTTRYQKWYNEVSKYFNVAFNEMMEVIEDNGYEYLYDLMKYFEENYEVIDEEETIEEEVEETIEEENYEVIDEEETINIVSIEETTEVMTITKGENIFKDIADDMLQQTIFEMMNEDYGEAVYLGDEEVYGLVYENVYKYVKYDAEYYAIQDKFNKIYYIPKDIFEIYFLIVDDKIHAWE